MLRQRSGQHVLSIRAFATWLEVTIRQDEERLRHNPDLTPQRRDKNKVAPLVGRVTSGLDAV